MIETKGKKGQGNKIREKEFWTRKYIESALVIVAKSKTGKSRYITQEGRKPLGYSA